MKLETFHNSDEPVIYAYYVLTKDKSEVFLDKWDAKEWAIENSNGEDYKIIPLYRQVQMAIIQHLSPIGGVGGGNGAGAVSA